MILGRPTNLWLGLVAAGLSFAQVAIVNLVKDADPTTVATLLGALGLLLGALISLIANQTPTVTQGDKINVITPQGEANKVITA